MKNLLAAIILSIFAAQTFASEPAGSKQKNVNCMQTKSYLGAIKRVEKKIKLAQSFVEDDRGSVTAVNHFGAINVANKYSVSIQILDILGQAGYGKITASFDEENSIASGCIADLCELSLSTAEQTTTISCKLE